MATPPVVSLLHLFGVPRSLRSVAEIFPSYPGLTETLDELVEAGFLVRPAERDRYKDWRNCFEAAYFHTRTTDLEYALTPARKRRYLLERLALAKQPPLYKRYRRAPTVRLQDVDLGGVVFGEVLGRRRTVRKFRNEPVGLGPFSTVVTGTWGRTGTIDAGLLGGLMTKTSPSAGARHPTESYLLVWSVSGIPPGLYHYDVKSSGLERLRLGDFRNEAVQFASGQKWIARAGFLCVMTAIVNRVFWKYGSSDAYRLFFLDAGHLAQTFALLATAVGLGPFTTAALQESKIQDFLGIDGVREFPIYLCGAGVTAGRASPISVLEPLPS